MTPTKPRYHLLSDTEMDDIETKSQLATLDRMIEKYQASKRQQASQPPLPPTEDHQ